MSKSPRKLKTASASALRKAWAPLIKPLCDHHGFTEEALYSKGRRKALVNCRKDVACALRNTGKLSTPDIGVILDRDHTTILYLTDSLTGKGKTHEKNGK